MGHILGFSRRNLLKSGIGAAAVWAAGAGPTSLQAEPAKKKSHIGLQMHSVRDHCGPDLADTLQALRRMGYDGVELAGHTEVIQGGYYGRKPKELRNLFDRSGLVCCGTHIPLEILLGDDFQKTVEYHRILGVKNLTLHGLPPKYLVSIATLVDAGKLLSEIAERLKAFGMQFGCHSQVRDIKTVEGRIPIEVAMAHASSDMHLQLDTGHCAEGGADPIALLKKFPGRYRSIHLAEFGGPRDAILGEGEVKWKDILEFCKSDGNVEWYIIERDQLFQRPSLEIAGLNLLNLRKMLA